MKIIKIALNSTTLRQSSLTTTATVVNGILGMLFYILAARWLHPVDYGLLILGVTTMSLIADVGTFGADTGLIKFVGRYFQVDSQKAGRFLKLALELRVITWVLVVAVGWWLMPYVADIILHKSEALPMLRLALLGVGGSLLFSFVTNSLQATQRYWSWSWLNIGLNGLRLVGLIGIGFFLLLSSENVFSWYIFLPFLGFLIGLFLLPKFLTISGEWVEAKEFFHYNKWVALFGLLAAVSARLDIYLLARLMSSGQLGIYSAANQLVAIIPQLVFAIAAVVAPKLASFDTDIKAKVYLKKLQLMVVGLALVGFLMIPLVDYLLPIVFGTDYIPSIGIFNILFVAQLIFLISLPVHQSVFYYFSKPKFFVLVSLINLIVMLSLGVYLIQQMGPLGAAVAVLVANLFNFIVPLIWVIWRFKQGYQR